MRVCMYFIIFTLAFLPAVVGCSSQNPAMPGQGGIDAGAPFATDEIRVSPSAGDASNPLSTRDTDPALKYVPDEVLVYFGGDPIPSSQMLALAQDNGLELIRKHEHFWGTFYQMRITDDTSVPDKCDRLKSLPGVEVAQPNRIVKMLAAPKEPYWPDDPLWESTSDLDDKPGTSVNDQWGPHLYGADLVWPEYTGEGVVIAILDSGVMPHEDLDLNLWTNPDEIPDNGIDDDENGYIDDIHGWDFYYDQADTKDGKPYHGTSCAGVAAARGDNGLGLSGIAPQAEIINLQVGNSYYVYIPFVLDAIDYAYKKGVDIISMSFGGIEYDELFDMACAAAYDGGGGLLLVAGAGNDDETPVLYPAGYTSVIAVGANCSFDMYGFPSICRRISHEYYSWGSNYGENLEVMAPGLWYSSPSGEGYSEYNNGPGQSDYFGGTSCATPFIAGTLALMKSAFPEMTGHQLRKRLRCTADDMGDPGPDIYYGMGRVNILRAIYGSDPNEDLADLHGFIPMEMNDSFNDCINPNYLWGYGDDADFYTITIIEDTYLTLELEILNWGKDLQLEVYDNPALEGPPVYVSDVENGSPLTNTEKIAGPVKGGNTYYLVVKGSSITDCTTYRLTTRTGYPSHGVKVRLIPSTNVDINIGSSAEWLGTMRLEVLSGAVELDSLTLSLAGNLPAEYARTFRLYEDSKYNGRFEKGKDTVIYESGPFYPANRAIVDLSGLKIIEGKPADFFVTLGLTKEAPLGSHVGLSVVTYKDLRVVDPAFVIHDNLQQTTGLKEITPVSFRFMDDDWGADCEDWYYPHLDEMGIDYEPCELGGEGGGLFSYGFIGDYDVTIWVTGNTDMVLHPKDLDFIEMYLDRGHGLLFISRDVGWQMDYWGASGKLEKLFHAEFVLDSSGATMVEGIDGDPVTDGLSNLKITGGYDKTQGKYDQLNPIAGASSILTYADGSGGSAGLRWEGNASHLILLQFPVESMELYDERQLLLERCIDWVAYD